MLFLIGIDGKNGIVFASKRKTDDVRIKAYENFLFYVRSYTLQYTESFNKQA